MHTYDKLSNFNGQWSVTRTHTHTLIRTQTMMKQQRYQYSLALDTHCLNIYLLMETGNCDQFSTNTHVSVLKNTHKISSSVIVQVGIYFGVFELEFLHNIHIKNKIFRLKMEKFFKKHFIEWLTNRAKHLNFWCPSCQWLF